MARYFFHSGNGKTHTDQDGAEFADVAAVKAAAAQFLSEALHRNPDLIWNTSHFVITVADESQATLFTLELTAKPGAP